MSGIKDYSTTAGDNTALFPEGMLPSTLNDRNRQLQADTRSWYEDAEWVNLGHTPTRTGNTTFTLSGDKTTTYTTGLRIKCTDSSTIYGTIVSSSYSAPNTTVTIHQDSGSGNLSASLSAVFIGTEKPTNGAMHANLGRKGSDIASASTVDLSAATGDFVDVTGTTTITALGTMAPGIMRVIRFTGALTLTHNGTTLILPGAVNITTANGDIAIVRSLGSGNWVCIAYLRASGSNVTLGFKGADIASASTVDLAAATGDFVDVTGTTTITALGTIAAGVERTVRFTGALTLTHNSTSLKLPTSANITTANGDVAKFRSLGSGNWVCVSYQKVDGTAVASASSSIGGSDTQVQFNDGGSLGGDSGLTYNKTTDVLTITNGIRQSGQVSFFADKNANQNDATGDTTQVDVTFTDEQWDNQSNFDGTTFTAPATGKYLFVANVNFSQLGSGHTQGDGVILVTSNRTYYGRIENFYAVSQSGVLYTSQSFLADLDVNDTAKIQAKISGSTKTVDIIEDATRFTGYLLG